MTVRVVGLCFALLAPCQAADEQPPAGQAGNDQLEIQATLFNDSKSIRGVLGQEMESGIVVLDVRLAPKGAEPLEVWREDFLLRSDKDGQTSEPFDPSQIAGASVLMVGSRGGGTAIMGEDRGPVWGGMGGPPRRLPGSGGTFGSGPSQERTEVATHEGSREPQNELLAVLEKKVLKEGETSKPVSGLLYFPMNGKHKVSQLELHYRGAAGKLSLRFKRPKR